MSEMTAFQGWYNCLLDVEYVEPVQDRRYIAGGAIDGDGGCVVVFDAEQKQMARIRYSGRQLFNFERIVKATFNEYKPAVIWIEVSGIGNVHIESLQASGLPVRGTRLTSRTHWNMFEDLARAIGNEQIQLLPDRQFLDALTETEIIPTKLQYKFATPPDRKGVSVIATALAWYGITHGGLYVDFV